jgi:hypothetical protein
MAVNIAEMRDALLPGLQGIVGSYSSWPAQWEALFAEEVTPLAPLAADFKVTEFTGTNILDHVGLPAALAIGAAAVVIKNPEVSRRGLFGWLRW